VDADEGHAGIEGILHLEGIAALVIPAARVEGLVNIPNQMDDPGQGIGSFFRRRAGSLQQAGQPVELVVQFSFTDPAVGVAVNVMPGFVAGSVRQAGEGPRRGFSFFIEKPPVLANIVSPSGGFQESEVSGVFPGPGDPFPVVRVAP